MAKLTNFHSDLALSTKILFVAYKILSNFCFGEISSSVQNLAEFCKGTERGRIRASYSDPMRITGPVQRSRRATSAARMRATMQLLAASAARRRGRPRLASFSPLSTSVGGAARFPVPSRKIPTSLSLEIHRTRSPSNQIDQSIASVTSLRTQRTPELTSYPTQSPGLPCSSPTPAETAAVSPLRGHAVLEGSTPF